MGLKKGQTNSGTFKKGESKGRPPGTPNALTKSVKEAVLNAFNKLQEDPNTCLEEWAKNNLKDFYLISARLIPTELDTKMTGVIKVIRE